MGQGNNHAKVPLADGVSFFPRPRHHPRRVGNLFVWCVHKCSYLGQVYRTLTPPPHPFFSGVLDIPYPAKAISLAQVLWGAIGWSVGAALGAAVAARERGEEGRTILFGQFFALPGLWRILV